MEVNLRPLSDSSKIFHIKEDATMDEFLAAAPARRAEIITKDLSGFGDLNAAHLSLCLSFCGYPCEVTSAGSNGVLGSEWLSEGAGVAVAHTRVMALLKEVCDDAPALAHGEFQAALCVWIYALQTWMTGSNGLHPRKSVGCVKVVPLVDKHPPKVDGRLRSQLKPARGFVYGGREFLPLPQYLAIQNARNPEGNLHRILCEHFKPGSASRSHVLVVLRVSPQGMWKHAS